MARREALGKGIGALFSQETEVNPLEPPVTTNESEVISKKLEETPKQPVITNESEVVSKKLEVTPKQPVITNESEVISKKLEVNPPEPPVITNESEVISKKSEVNPPEPPVSTNESEVISKKSEVISKKSEVISKKSEVITSAEKNKNQKQRPGSRAYKRKQRSPATKTKQKIEAVDQEILEQAITEGLESPRLSTWSPLVMSTLRYLQLTTGRFSMSREVSETLEAAFREKYPELFERIEKEIGER